MTKMPTCPLLMLNNPADHAQCIGETCAWFVITKITTDGVKGSCAMKQLIHALARQ